MLKGIHTAASGMVPRVRKQELIANNVANAGTPGFKRDMMFTQELSKAQAKFVPVKSDWEQPMVDRTYVDYTAGSFDRTGNPLDLALEGDGFFQLQDAEGNVFLTRAGMFELDSEGYVAFPGGFRLIGEGGPVQAGQGDIVIGEDGTMQVNGLTVDRIVPRDVPDQSVLEKAGNSLFKVPEGAELIAALRPSVKQGYLEAANVDVVAEMVEMIVAYRTYEANAKSLQTQDGTLDNLFRRVAGNE